MSSIDGDRNRAHAAAGALIAAVVLTLLACTPAPPKSETATAPAPGPSSRPGGYYKDDGPGENPPANLDAIAEPTPRVEPLNRFANRPYSVFGREYIPATSLRPYKERGIASWYGRKFHNQKTSTGETYDMYAMTAAHPTLPIPSYARVTNLANGRSVVVRVNDRGPFHADRIVDLSYTAAYKLGYAANGSARVELQSIVPGTVVAAAPAAAAPAPTAIREEAGPEVKPAPEPSAEPKGVYVQLGAFSARDGAENFRVRVYRELAWLSESIQVLAADGLYKLHLGPYRSREEARSIADRIQGELSFRPSIVVR